MTAPPIEQAAHSLPQTLSPATRDLLLSNLFASDHLGILLLEGKGSDRRAVAANDFFCRLFHLSKDRVLGMEVERLASRCRKRIVHENSAPALMVEGFMASGAQQICEFELVEPAGQMVRQTSSPAFTDDGEPCGRLVLYRSVTLDRQAEDQALHRQKMESIGTLAGGIAHDFNNILTAIFGYTGALMSECAEQPTAMEKLHHLQKSASRAAELTSNLLAFSRKNPHLPMPINLSTLCESTSSMLMFTMPEGIRLEIDVMPDLPYVEADPSQLQQVVTQLIVNARDAILGEGTIRVSTRIGKDTQAEPGNDGILYAIVDVEDTGIGVPSENISRIFEPFYTTKELGKGVGLGLSMVYGVLKQHRGFIEVESAINEGSRFSIFLPVMVPQPTFEDEPQENLPSQPLNATIMIVEDEPELRELCSEALAGVCAEVVLARDGLEAVQTFRARHGRIDLVLLDLTMPVMGGKECFHELRDINPDVKILICSGYSEEMGASELLEAGAVGFLAKPYTLPALVRRVADCLE